MIFGGILHERLQFNEDSLWIGDETDTGAYQAFGDLFVDFGDGDDAVTGYPPCPKPGPTAMSSACGPGAALPSISRGRIARSRITVSPLKCPKW
jgi:hypothetical protein